MRWEETKLWLELQRTDFETEASRLNVEVVRTRLKVFMPEVWTVLAKGETSAADFTLHDEDHGFRVAERMVEIITPDELRRLTPTELAFLLLTAYLHDIGMTPERGHVRAHREYLLTGDRGPLTDAELAELQKWLDDNADGVTPPVVTGTPTISDYRRIDELITYYSRHKHNDWSEQWIRKHLASPDRELYRGWIDDLVAVCKSHHYGYRELVTERFAPRLAGAARPEMLHLRYIAAVLRVADILEFDPERTPDIILRHRDVAAGSLTYWRKDHDVQLLRNADDQLLFQARPKQAYVQRAIELMADDIDRELSLCANLANERRFTTAPLPLGDDFDRGWSLKPMLSRRIESDGSYVYVDGSFRPNTPKLLELLSGTALYDSPLSAIRELIQNAFDAVKEKIAYQRLEQEDPLDPKLVEALTAPASITLELGEDENGLWLSCTDTGIGMTKEIISNQFLVSGSPRNHQTLDLDRRCREKGFLLGRTGQFGIGALSYFMIAESVTITTRRSQEARDAEESGWTFTSGGIGSFGELRKNVEARNGTEVYFRLRKGIIAPDVPATYQKIEQYLTEILLRSPCAIRLRCTQLQQKRDIPAGWSAQEERRLLHEIALPPEATVENADEAILSASDVEIRSRQKKALTVLRTHLQGALSWRRMEGGLREGGGAFRLSIPIFALEGGDSAVHIDPNGWEMAHSVEYVFAPDNGGGETAWKGIAAKALIKASRTDLLSEFLPSLSVIDFVDGTTLQLRANRESLVIPRDRALNLSADIRRHYSELAAEWLGQNASSPYCVPSAIHLGVMPPPGARMYWTLFDDAGHCRYTEITQPYTFKEIYRREAAKSWRGAPLLTLLPLGATDQRLRAYYVNPNPMAIIPSYVALCEDRVMPICCPQSLRLQQPEFSPSWSTVAVLNLSANLELLHQFYWNIENPLFVLARPDSDEWNPATGPAYFVTRAHLEAAALSPQAAARLLLYLATRADNTWLGANEQHPELADAIWRQAFGNSQDAEVVVLEQGSFNRLRRSTIDERRRLSELPDPGDDWKIFAE